MKLRKALSALTARRSPRSFLGRTASRLAEKSRDKFRGTRSTSFISRIFLRAAALELRDVRGWGVFGSGSKHFQNTGNVRPFFPASPHVRLGCVSKSRSSKLPKMPIRNRWAPL